MMNDTIHELVFIIYVNTPYSTRFFFFWLDLEDQFPLATLNVLLAAVILLIYLYFMASFVQHRTRKIAREHSCPSSRRSTRELSVDSVQHKLAWQYWYWIIILTTPSLLN